MALAFIVGVFLQSPALAQSGGGGGGESSEPQASTLDLPLIGEIELPDWLSFLGSSSSGSSEDNGSGGGSASGGGSGGGQSGGQGQQPPPAVVVTEARLRSVGDEFEFIGTIEAIENVTLQARVNGFIEQVFFNGGDEVAVGDMLFKIEDDQYQAALDSSNAELAGAEAQLSEAQRSLNRAQELIDSGTIPQAELDNARAAFESARATRLQAQASVRQAQLNLDYTSITAPIDGVISEPMITRGNFVSAASGTLANIVQLDPIWGTFPIGEDRISTLRRVGVGADEASESADNYRLTLRLPGDTTFGESGSFAFVSNTVDANTGTIETRVRFPNPEGRLLPNENVTLVASEREPPMLPVVPRSAIQLSREGQFLFLLNGDDDTVRKQPVETGQTMRGDIAITSGVDEGDLVIVQGVQNLEDGMAVTPNFEGGSQGSNGSSSGLEESGEEGSAASQSERGSQEQASNAATDDGSGESGQSGESGNSNGGGSQ